MFKIAYCSNVHAGSNLTETRANLGDYSGRVKQLFSPEQSMGIGLWLSAESANSLLAQPEELRSFQQFFSENGLDPFTYNGFPYGNFHREVVKRDVYLPSWYDADRRNYTENLVKLSHQLGGSNPTTISTLPIAWGNPLVARGHLAEAGRHMRELAKGLSQLEAETGHVVSICIEPEPGCAIQKAQDVVDFFEKHLVQPNVESDIRRHIRVCHDVCHAVVMREPQKEVLKTYCQAGISVGKIQVSSAVVVDFDAIPRGERANAFAQLSGFAEDRYLHQTTVHMEGETSFYEDLPDALQTVPEPKQAAGEWRVHFHVPVYLSQFGLLGASQQAIVDCLTSCREYSDVEHFEVETYAWNVLPTDLQEDNLAQGIANELIWFKNLAEEHLD